MSAPRLPTPAVVRGFVSALTAVGLLALALLPSRLAVAMRVRGGSLFERATRALAGTALDLSSVIVPLAVLLLTVALLVALLPGARRAVWQHLFLPLVVLPLCLGLYLVTVTEQELKAERGAFSTMQELAEGASQASLVEGSLGFIHYQRIWVPLLVCGALALGLLAMRARSALQERGAQARWRGWALGVLAVLALAVLLVPGAVAAAGTLSARLSPAGLGDPLASLIETTLDLAQHREAERPSELLLQLEPSLTDAALGAARMGWPPRRAAEKDQPCWPHPHARPLDRASEPAPRGAELLEALEHVSEALFDPADAKVAVFQFSLESFRADDVHALHSAAPHELDPFVSSLYEAAQRGSSAGVLASAKTFQAGVRSAQGLAAMTCGVGTLPYNLSIIRDLDGFPLRCATDLLSEAGFAGTFFYGSDPGFDLMGRFLKAHGVARVVSQDELPTNLPKGAWSGLTDFVVFDEAARQVSKALAGGSQYALVMSLSNHSPYAPPEDLPPSVREQVDRALAQAVNRASPDDYRRLLTHAYTDAALARFFAKLDALGLSQRSIVVLAADHSTGEDYVWGPNSIDHETDAAKAQVPFLVVIPPAFLARAKDRPAVDMYLTRAQRLLEVTPLSQNDVPALLLALLKFHPGLRALPAASRWHTLGGQTTSPWFQPGGEAESYLLGINGVDELYALDRKGARVGPYEDVVFLKTRSDRERVTPRLIPVASALVETLRAPTACTPVSRAP